MAEPTAADEPRAQDEPTGQAEESWWRRWGLPMIVVLVAVLVIAALGVLWASAERFYDDAGVDPKTRETAAATTRAGILVAIGAIVAALGATLALLETRRANRASHEREVRVLAETQRANRASHEREVQLLKETHRANRDADLRERYTRAIDQLGHKSVEVRLGGIYALHRIVETSDDDLPTVVDVLSAFVRGHGQGPGDKKLEDHRPPADVQAAMSVVGRIHDADRGSEVDLDGAHLECTRLLDAKLHKARLVDAYLSGANLNRAKLTAAILINLELTDAYLWRADLADAFLLRADLTDASLKGADLSGARLKGADLTGADLTGADLSGADLTGAIGLTQDQLEAAKGTERTELSEGLTRPEHWISRPSAPGAPSEAMGSDPKLPTS